jgi:Ca2+-binding RTX toxin-like protein
MKTINNKDTIFNESGQPDIDGGDGADTVVNLQGTAGTIAGGDGNDLVGVELANVHTVAGGTYDGGAGNDVIDVSHDVIAADCETVVIGQPPAGSPIAALQAERDDYRTITAIPDPVLPAS